MNILSIILGENDDFLRGREACVAPADSQMSVSHIVPPKFRDDVKALADYVGKDDFKDGILIEVSLSELLDIIPRKRRRADSYATLIKYLKEERGIILTIKTLKHA